MGKIVLSLTEETPVSRDLQQEQEALLDSIWDRHPGFAAAENLTRKEIHARDDLR